VNASLLARGGGSYRCGKCNTAGNALESLFDEWPGPGDKPVTPGELPVLGLAIDLDKAAESRLNPGEAALTGDGGGDVDDGDGGDTRRGGNLTLRLAWVTMAVVIVLAAVFGYSKFSGKPLLEHPAVQSAMITTGLKEAPKSKPYRDLSRIQLVSRELKNHPGIVGMLRLTATIVNRAPESQPFPGLEVILLDANGQALSTYRFTPSQYLAPGSPRGSGMTPEAYLPLSLDFPDPGESAVGFELNFL